MPYLFPEIDESVDIGFELTFPNRVITTDNGSEQRIVPRQSPLRTYSFVKKIVNSVAIATVFNFYASLSGATTAFGYRDKSDYLGTSDAYGIAGGVYTQGVVVGSGGRYQLCKRYTCGSNTHYRPIFWATNLTIYQGGSPVTGWTLLEGGEITGLSGSGHTADFTFYTKVRFEESISRTLSTAKSPAIYSLNNVQLVEVPNDIPFPINDVFNNDVGLTLSSDTRDSLSSNFAVEINKLPSGFEKRQRRGIEVTTLNFGTFALADQVALDYLLCFWLNTKGSGAFFSFEDLSETIVTARFGQEGEQESKFSYTLKIGQPISYYEVSGLSARLFYEGILSNDNSVGALTGNVLTLCDCVKLNNLYTTHDRPIVIDGMTAITSESILFSAIEQTANLDPNNAEIVGVQGIITADLITNQSAQEIEVVLLKGVNWRNPPATIAAHPVYLKQTGQIGEVTVQGETMWSVQIQDNIKRKLSQQIIKVTSPLCSHRFCDSGCTLDTADYTFDTTIATVSSQTQFQLAMTSLDFSFGTVTFLSGANTGLVFSIASGVAGLINLAEIPGKRIASGDQVRVFRGCEKTPEYCKVQFGNYVNFLGIPTSGKWMPGVDAYQNPGVRRE